MWRTHSGVQRRRCCRRPLAPGRSSVE